jgi:TRAP-type mannitol/chloroaromatic compound transport system permease small subunit
MVAKGGKAMPNIGFVLPHWLYWAGLVVFPLVAMYLSRQKQPEPGSRTVGIAYFIWAVGGFFGFHRLYLKNKWGVLYWPLFGIILFASSMEREARIVFSDANGGISAIASSTERTLRTLEKANIELEDARTKLAEIGTAEEDQSRRDRLQRTIDRQTDRATGAETKLQEMAAEKIELEPQVLAAAQDQKKWSTIAFSSLMAIVAFMVLDLFLIPSMTKKARQYLKTRPDGKVEREILGDDQEYVGKGLAGVIDRISLFTGEFVALWSVIAVFVYYYEVIVRYVFNSPTNWAHEGMFLMFGMQYLIAGSYAMLTESHVRVDIFYANFSPRGKAITDLLTSVFFFIFAATLIWTGWIFAMDSVRQGEVSFTEWGIQYWPVKLVIVLGGVLLFLQGLSRLSKDIALVISPKQEATNGS